MIKRGFRRHRIRVGFVGSLLLALSLSTNPAQAITGSGEIRDFFLNSCGSKICIQLQSDKASVGRLDASFGFAKAKFVMTEVKTNRRIEFTAADVYYDQSSQKIFLREIKERPKQEAYFDLVTEEIRYFLH